MKKIRIFVSAAIVFAGILVFAACGSEHGSECFYAPTCLDKCGGKIVKSGCTVRCDPPLVEKMTCTGMDAPEDVPPLIQDTGVVDTGSDAPADSPTGG